MLFGFEIGKARWMRLRRCVFVFSPLHQPKPLVDSKAGHWAKDAQRDLLQGGVLGD